MIDIMTLEIDIVKLFMKSSSVKDWIVWDHR